MGIFDWFPVTARCPACGETRATRSWAGRIRCPNRQCTWFDANLMNQLAAEGYAADDSVRSQASHPRSLESAPTRGGSFEPKERLEVRYRNYLGEEKTFVGDATTLRQRGCHYSLRVVPTGRRITLAEGRIGNVSEVRACLAQYPNPREARILRYHARRGTTSELNEKLRARYPRWRP